MPVRDMPSIRTRMGRVRAPGWESMRRPVTGWGLRLWVSFVLRALKTGGVEVGCCLAVMRDFERAGFGRVSGGAEKGAYCEVIHVFEQCGSEAVSRTWL